MKILSFLFILSSLALCPLFAEAEEVVPGGLFHITGCEKGELVVPEVNLWSVPGGAAAGPAIVGILSGDGRKDQGLKCQGAVVKALEIKNIEGRTYIKIKTVVGLKIGWITDSFVGKRFKRSHCKNFFSEPEYQATCLEK